MAIAGITVEGLRELRAALNRVPEEATTRLTGAITDTVIGAQRRMWAGSRRRTGTQQHAIQTRGRGLHQRVVIDRSAFYWFWQEYGTVYVPATPFVRPAREAETIELDKRVKGIATVIERDWSAGRFA